jgi:phytanoyl-CoA hydroxylase
MTGPNEKSNSKYALNLIGPRGWPACPETLNEGLKALYWERGYLAFEGVLSPSEVEAVRSGLSEIIAQYAFQEDKADYRPPADKSGKMSGAVFFSKNSRCSFQLEAGFEISPADRADIESKVRKFMWIDEEADIFRSLRDDHPRLRGVVDSLLGADPSLYQSMALVKPAHHGSEKAWHQDNAYFSVQNLDAMLGVWIALDDATVENGTMHFLPGGHQAGPLKHFHSDDCEIEKDRYSPDTAEPVCLKAGGAVFFHGNIPHFTPRNHSPNRRRALQYHFRAATNPVVDRDEYNRVFVEADGTPASCAAARPENF